jgi:hypothetical protein
MCRADNYNIFTPIYKIGKAFYQGIYFMGLSERIFPYREWWFARFAGLLYQGNMPFFQS